jgi:hypothetical protein
MNNTTLHFYVRALKFCSCWTNQQMQIYEHVQTHTHTHNIQGVSRLEDITAGGDFVGLCDQKSSYKHVSDFGQLRSYGHFLIPVRALI